MWFPDSTPFVEPKFSISKWVKELPTVENVGQWFFVKTVNSVRVMEVRKDGNSLYLCEPCNAAEGILKTSYGTNLNCYLNVPVEFCGPIQMPPSMPALYAEYRSKKH